MYTTCIGLFKCSIRTCAYFMLRFTDELSPKFVFYSINREVAPSNERVETHKVLLDSKVHVAVATEALRPEHIGDFGLHRAVSRLLAHEAAVLAQVAPTIDALGDEFTNDADGSSPRMQTCARRRST